MYLTGTGTEQDNEKAFMYLVKSAENEEADPGVIGPAPLTIAQMYEKGIGVEKNGKEAAAAAVSTTVPTPRVVWS